MENRLKRFGLCAVFLLVIFVIPFQALGYDSTTTHPALTSSTAQFYNLLHPQSQLSFAVVDWLQQGSIAEDGGYRWLNHAYDPIYNRGWFKDINSTKIGLTSKQWSNDKLNQISYGSHSFVVNPLEWLAGVTKNINQSENNQTWERAIYDYIKGNKKDAFYALGHIVHLIQDGYVPAHTRQNPHSSISGTESSYESWASQFDSNQLANYGKYLIDHGVKQLNAADLNSYFDLSASYSNNYFYSEDTINSSEYKKPEVLYDRVDGKYLVGQDENKELFKLATRTGLIFRVLSGPSQYSLNDPEVLQDYRDRLFPKAVASGSGVIDLFFKEVDKYKNDKDFLARNSQNLLSDLAKVFTGWIGNVSSNKMDYVVVQNTPSTNNAETTVKNTNSSKTASASTNKSATTASTKVDSSSTKTAAKSTTADKETSTTKTDSSKKTTDSQTKQTDKKTEDNSIKITTVKVTPSFCSFVSNSSSDRSKVIINEVAWMGTTSSASDEWIELKNISGNSVDISNWQLISKEENIKAIIPDNTTIPAGGFYLLERTDDNSVSSVTADLIYTGGLNNSDDGLKLFNNNCLLMDEVLASLDWPAGNNANKLTMERDSSGFNWHTSSVINGTPKANNSAAFVPLPPAPQPVNTSTTTATSTDNNATSTSSTDNNATSTDSVDDNQTPTYCTLPSSLSAASHLPIIINEVAWMGSSNSANDEWIELKNISDAAIDIKDWQLMDGKDHIKIVFGLNSENTLIPSSGFYLMERTNDDSVPNIAADLIYTGNTNNNDDSLILFNKDCEIIDGVEANVGDNLDWPAGDNESRRTMERSSDLTWHSYSGNGTDNIYGTPKAENSEPLPISDDDTDDDSNSTTYVKHVSWHLNPSDNSRVTLEFEADAYPFISNQELWAGMVFYFNQDVPDYPLLNGDWMVDPGSGNRVLAMKYYNCAGYVFNSTSLILPVPNDMPDSPWCSSFSGAPRNYAYSRGLIPSDNHFVLDVYGILDINPDPVKISDLTKSDYITLGFYLFDGSRPGNLTLVLKDNHKYHFKVEK